MFNFFPANFRESRRGYAATTRNLGGERQRSHTQPANHQQLATGCVWACADAWPPIVANSLSLITLLMQDYGEYFLVLYLMLFSDFVYPRRFDAQINGLCATIPHIIESGILRASIFICSRKQGLVTVHGFFNAFNGIFVDFITHNY